MEELIVFVAQDRAQYFFLLNSSVFFSLCNLCCLIRVVFVEDSHMGYSRISPASQVYADDSS